MGICRAYTEIVWVHKYGCQNRSYGEVYAGFRYTGLRLEESTKQGSISGIGTRMVL